MGFNLDISIVLVFLLLTIFVGMGHGKKIKTLEDYALGNRDFSTAALIATIVATYASGSHFMITLNRTYSNGLYHLIASIGGALSFVILACVLVPRMREFLGKLSIAEAMGGLYGKEARVITAVTGTIGSSGLIAVQFKVFGSIFSNFLGFPTELSIIIAGAIATIYSAFGGIRAVTFTDVLQFFAFGIIIPLLSFVIWNDFYDSGHSIREALSHPKYDISYIFDTTNPQLLGLVMLFTYYLLPTFSPPAFQRIAMGRDIAQVKKAFIISAFCLILIDIAIAWIPFLIHTINPTIKSGELLPYIINTYSYNGLKGAIIVAIIAFTMSTADSRINVSAVMFTNDICKVFTNRPLKDILISRIFSLFLGVGAILLALKKTDLLEIIIAGNSFYYPVVAPVFLLTIFGFKSSKKSVLIAMASGTIFTLIWQKSDIKFEAVSASVVGVLLAMLTNVVALFLSHYLLRQPGGWVKTQGSEDVRKERLERRKQWAERWLQVKQFNIITYLRGCAPKRDDMYVRVGAYFIIYTLTTMYTTHTNLSGPGKQLLSWIYPFMLITGTMMLIYHLWPSSISQRIRQVVVQIWWPLSLFYMLILFSGFFVLLSDFSLLQSLVAFLNILVVITLYKWQMAMIALPIGFYLSSQLYESIYGHYQLQFDPGSPEAVMAYLMILCGTAIIMFVKPKQEYLEVTERKVSNLAHEVTVFKSKAGQYQGKIDSLSQEVNVGKEQINSLAKEVTTLNDKVGFYTERVEDQAKEIERLGATSQKILNNVTHELRLPVGNVMNFASLLSESLDKLPKDQLKELSDEVLKNSERLSTMIMNMLDLATLDTKKLALNKQIINLGELTKDRVERCQKIYLEDKPIDIKLTVQPELLIAVDPNYIKQIVDNLMINALKYSEEGLIEVEVREEMSGNMEGAAVVIKDQGIGIPKEEIFDIFTPFKTSSKTLSRAEGRGVGLSLCKTAAEAHGGHIEVRSGAKGAQFTVWLPIITRKIIKEET
jgi:Na+/proline symporter/signal transduction histidine kinase